MWMAYAEIEPFGEQRAEISRSLVGTAICNVLGRVNGMKRDVFKPMDLVPTYGGDATTTKPGRGAKKPVTDAESWKRTMGMWTEQARDGERAKSRRETTAEQRARRGPNLSERRRALLRARGKLA